MIVSQSFHVFNRYGKGNEALADITRVFIEDLKDYETEQIVGAFKEWRKRSDAMPAPANIIKLINENKVIPTGLMQFQEFKQRGGGDWKAYKRHLADNGEISPNLDEYSTIVSKNKIWGKRYYD